MYDKTKKAFWKEIQKDGFVRLYEPLVEIELHRKAKEIGVDLAFDTTECYTILAAFRVEGVYGFLVLGEEDQLKLVKVAGKKELVFVTINEWEKTSLMIQSNRILRKAQRRLDDLNILATIYFDEEEGNYSIVYD